ncbi:MAG: hypothetical protein GXY30_03620 [Xanthomonadaceae bacterium]|jgi:hypothetical protein|nr:hypothetical protein [Xanthomonadaceae bacterium]HLT44955.1 DUF6164 family protein [Luteimonas sp.]
MAKLLLNLRHVPDDEADEVRALLDAARIGYYETRPGPLGISAGGIWIRDDDEFPAAKQRMARYQAERAQRARAERAQALRDGTAETFLGIARAQPLRVALVLLAIALLLGLMALPAYLIWR